MGVATGSHSPDPSAVLSHQPSDHGSILENDANEVPGFPGHRILVRANTLDAGAPLSSLCLIEGLLPCSVF